MNKTLCFLSIILLVFFINTANAQDSSVEKYSIKKGDTLWDISDTKFQDSFLWPNLWRVNPQIENPDQIYPGDTIRIPSKEELMRMMAKPAEEISEKMPVAVEPEIEDILPIKPVVVKPVKHIISKYLYVSSGWISSEFSGIGKIYASPDHRTLFGNHDLVYVKSKENLQIGDQYFLIRTIKKVKHPKTGKFLGYQVRVTGILEIIGMDGINNDVPKAQITTAFEDIHTGDRLSPFTEMVPPVIPDNARTPDISGYVIESNMNYEMASSGDIVYLDKGSIDGVEVGDTFSALIKKPDFVSSALVKNPMERSIATIQVFSLQPTTSAAVILQSEQDISIGSIWGNKEFSPLTVHRSTVKAKDDKKWKSGYHSP